MHLSSGFGRKAGWSPILMEVLGKKTIVVRFENGGGMTCASELMIDLPKGIMHYERRFEARELEFKIT